MASVAQLKGRIRSVNSTKQITGAMQLVAASKMRKAANNSLSTQDYHRRASELLMHLANEGATDKYGLFVHRLVRTRLLIVIASDTGLAGAYNSNVFKEYVKALQFDRERGVKTLTIAVGRKIAQYASRLDGVEVIGSYEGMTNNVVPGEREAIANIALEKYRSGEVDAVDVIYTKFRSSISQEVKTWALLPAGHVPGIEISEGVKAMTFEPSRGIVLDFLVERLLQVQVVQAILDSAASEHSTRMMAMKNATDNATDLGEDLTLAMNKERQAAITQEISEISNGAEAVE
jgi:F-type H+-transporting ATPase subunit gamma